MENVNNNPAVTDEDIRQSMLECTNIEEWNAKRELMKQFRGMMWIGQHIDGGLIGQADLKPVESLIVDINLKAPEQSAALMETQRKGRIQRMSAGSRDLEAWYKLQKNA